MTEKDVQLNVKGVTGLEAAFEDFTQEEVMDGENQYQSEGFGLQDAKKGLIFTTLPRVLHLQLKRFDFDWNTQNIIKVILFPLWQGRRSADDQIDQ